MAVLRGVDEVGAKVMGTAEKVASLRVGMSHARKDPNAVIGVVPLSLPPVRHLTAGDDEVIDL